MGVFNLSVMSDMCMLQAGVVGGGRLGTLAAVLGSGEVQLLSVPHPDHHDRSAAAADTEDAHAPASRGLPGDPCAPRFVRLRPQATAAASTVSGSLPSVVEWLPSAPHDLLLVWCSSASSTHHVAEVIDARVHVL